MRLIAGLLVALMFLLLAISTLSKLVFPRGVRQIAGGILVRDFFWLTVRMILSIAKLPFRLVQTLIGTPSRPYKRRTRRRGRGARKPSRS